MSGKSMVVLKSPENRSGQASRQPTVGRLPGRPFVLYGFSTTEPSCFTCSTRRTLDYKAGSPFCYRFSTVEQFDLWAWPSQSPRRHPGRVRFRMPRRGTAFCRVWVSLVSLETKALVAEATLTAGGRSTVTEGGRRRRSSRSV